jgi:hypothetical protein
MKAQAQQGPRSRGAPGRGQQQHRGELLQGRSERNPLAARGASDYGGVGRDMESGGGLEQQQMLLRQQDEVLDDVIQATRQLGEMGQTIGAELGQQSKLIDEVKNDVEETNNKIMLAKERVEKMLASQSEQRLMCLMCMLIGVFIALSLLVFEF